MLQESISLQGSCRTVVRRFGYTELIEPVLEPVGYLFYRGGAMVATTPFAHGADWHRRWGSADHTEKRAQELDLAFDRCHPDFRAMRDGFLPMG
eukprot:6367777-Amphidinium_carterae.3